MIESLLWVILAYFIGAIPVGYLIGRFFYGKDLRKEGSGNIGATNAYRILGTKAGIFVFLLDFFKGWIAASLGTGEPYLVLACAIASVVGSDWSVFLKFKSGKGVACGVGAFTYISPAATFAAFLVWLFIFLWKKIVSLASIISVPVVPLVIFLTGSPLAYSIGSLLAALLVIGKHKENMKRLWRGEEKPIVKGKRT